MINFDDIKIVALDCDGVLTDGIFQESSTGTVTKSFYTRDFWAINQLLKNDIIVIIITGSNDTCMESQLERIYGPEIYEFNYEDFQCRRFKDDNLILFKSVKEKSKVIDDFIFTNSKHDWDNVAYMGDSENDLEPIKKSAYTGCPCDAIREIKDESNFKSDFSGGKGAVYDFVNYILEKKGLK